MSELSCCATINPRDDIRIGTCGPAMPGVEVRLADDGFQISPRLAAATLALDALKAVPVVLAAKWLALPIMWQGLVGLAVLLGHSFPLWYGFRGGKAVASAFGVLLVLVPSVALLSALAWALMAWRLGTAALASVASALLAPLLCAWLAPAYTGVVGGFSLLVLARHMLNIRRWRQGEEPPLRK